MTRVSFPNRSALVMRRVFVDNGGDQPAAYALAKEILLTPLSQ